MKKWKVSYTTYRKGNFASSFILTYAVDEDRAREDAMLALLHELQSLKALKGVFKIEIDQIEEVTNAKV